MRKSIEIKFLNEVFFRFGLKLTCTGKTLKDIASLGVKSQGIHIRFTNLYKILNVIYLCSKVALLFCLYVYLEFFVPLENVLLIWRHQHCRRRSLSYEDSLTCYTYCDTVHPFIIVIPRTSDTHTKC